MNNATVVSFEEAMRNRAGTREPQPTITMEALKARQGTIALSDCHVALDRVTYHIKTKKRRYSVFEDLSVGFPKGRHIVILGHKGSGKSTLLNLIGGRLSPLRGKVYRPSRISWPVHQAGFFDAKATVKANIIFCARVLGFKPSRVLDMAAHFCELTPKQMLEPLTGLRPQIKRRLGYLIVLMADCDMHLFDTPFKGAGLGFAGRDAQDFETFGLQRDYIMTATQLGAIPDNVDLAYILYDGRLYMFEDVFKAVEVYRSLPVPDTPDLAAEAAAEATDEQRLEEF